MTVLMGPVLALLETKPGAWLLGVLVVTDAPPGKLLWTQPDTRGDAAGTALWKDGKRTAYGFRFEVRLPAASGSLIYQVAGLSFQTTLPGVGQPPRLAYASCNGFSDPKLMKQVDDNNRMWKALAARHAATPFNLLLMGGDQVYADEVWTAIEEMRRFSEASFAEADGMSCPPALRKKLDAFYFDLYVRRWSQPDVAAMLAVIPSIMMWDDHDTIDGWGSYPIERQTCPIFKDGIGPSALKAFRCMQKQVPAEKSVKDFLFSSGMSQGFVFDRMAVLAIDMRAERSIEQVLSRAHWDAVYDWLDGLADLDHLIIMSSIPVIYPGFDTLEKLLVVFPGYQDLEDDLRDHWNSPGHKVERLRLVLRLLDLARDKKIMPTLVSGDVHVAALGVVESSLHKDAVGNGITLHQLISSGIVHPGPGATVVFTLNELFDSRDELETGICGRMVTFPTSQRKFIGSRNFLTIEPDTDRMPPRLWANWWIENGAAAPALLTKVISPLAR